VSVLLLSCSCSLRSVVEECIVWDTAWVLGREDSWGAVERPMRPQPNGGIAVECVCEPNLPIFGSNFKNDSLQRVSIDYVMCFILVRTMVSSAVIANMLNFRPNQSEVLLIQLQRGTLHRGTVRRQTMYGRRRGYAPVSKRTTAHGE
jgi:hypothetical protein